MQPLIFLISQANLARWEPAHGSFNFRHPWQQYVKIGAAMRRCAYCLENLSICMNYETEVSYHCFEESSLRCCETNTPICVLISAGTRPGQESFRRSLYESELSFFKNLERVSGYDQEHEKIFEDGLPGV